VKTRHGFKKVISGILAFSMIFSLTAPTGAVVRADEVQDNEAQESELREIGNSDKEPVILKNDTGSDITFISSVSKDELDKDEYTNKLSADEVIAVDETVKFYADFNSDTESVIVIKCNGTTYYINTFDYFATDLSKEVSVKHESGYDLMYLAGTAADGQSFSTLDDEIALFSQDKADEITEVIPEEKTKEITEAAVETFTEEKKETATEKKPEETTEAVTEEKTVEESTEVKSKKIEEIDASSLSYRLLVASDDDSIFTDGYVISSYDGIYLVGYKTESARIAGYDYYQDKAVFVEFDDEIYEIADNDSTQTDASEAEVVNQDDALTVLNELEESEVKDEQKVIALIDTGANSKVVDAVSVIGDVTTDDNGHGSLMADTILKENPDAKILSIKAFDANGKAKPSDIYAAVRYAIDNKVSIINMSFSAFSTEDNTIVKDIVEEAVNNGITVIGAAGNNGKNVKYFIPGNIENAMIAGSVDKDGYKKNFSNYGDTVDYYVVSESTSEAAAKLSGIISKNGKKFKNDSVILPKDTKFEEKKDDEKDKEEKPLEEGKGTFDVQAYNGSGDGQAYLTYIKDMYVTWGDDVYSSSFGVPTREFFIIDGTTWNGESWNAYCVDPSLTKPDKGMYKVYEVGVYIGKVMYYMYGAPGWDTSLDCLGNKSMHQYVNEQGYTSESGYVTVCHYLLATLAQTQSLGGTGYSDSPNWVQGLATVLVNGAPNPPKGFHCYFAFSYEKNHDWQNVWGWKMSPPPYMVTLEKKSTIATDTRSMDGIKYGLYNAENKLIATYTLGANGKTKAIDIYKGAGSIAGSDDAVVNENGTLWLEWWSSLSSQNWYFKELNTNSNYAVKSTVSVPSGNWTSDVAKYNVTVKQGENTTGNASDAPVYGKIEVFKYADNNKNKPLSGAEFTVYKDAGCTQAVGKMGYNDGNGRHEYTSPKGFATYTGLAPGTYYVKETKAPEGYEKNDTVYTVNISVPSGQVSWGDVYMGYIFDPVYYFDKTLNATDRSNLHLTSTSSSNLSAEDINTMFRHYIRSGLTNEVGSRIGNPSFRADQYLANRPDLVTAWANETNKANYNNSINVFAAVHYARHGAREGSMGRNEAYYAGLNEGVNNNGQISVTLLVSNKPEKYYVGIKKYDADNPNQFIAATFDIYGTNTSGATSGGTKINALSGKSTSATTGLLNVEVTDYYNPTTTNVAGKYRYFYAVETQTDNNHVITVNTKALTVGKNVTYTDWPNARKTYVQLIKSSANPDCVKNNPNYSLAGTQFKVFKTQAEARAALTSKDYSASIGNLNITTDRIGTDGIGRSNLIDVSSYMSVNTSTGKFRSTTFYAIESTAGKGYEISNAVHPVTVNAENINNNPAKLNVENTPTLDPVSININKVDVDGNPVAEGAGNLEGAQFTIKFYAVDTSVNYTAAQLAQRIADATWTIETKYVSSDNVYRARLGADWLVGGESNNSPFYYAPGNTEPMFPAGYITIQETKAPAGYTTGNPIYKSQTSGAVVTNTNGVIVANTRDMENLTVGNMTFDGAILLEEKPIRGNFELFKTDKAGSPMANVEFEIKSETSGESYTIKTGADGKYNSEAAGLWFGKKTDGSETAKIDGLGALPVGEYTVTELRCDANKGYQLQPAIRFTVSEAITYVVKDGKVTEDAIYNVKNPEITTTASVTETGTKLAPQNSNVTIKDTVSYSNLKVDTDFIAVGRLMVVNEDGTSYVYQKNGSDYIVTKPFKTGADYTKSVYEATGSFDVEFTVDTTDLDGKKLVVVEKLYLGTTVPADDASAAQYPGTTDKIFPVVHENLDDNNQTIIIPKVITQAYKTGDTANKTISAVANASITDTITYTNLDTSLTYTVKSSLIDKANGNVLKDATGKEVTVTNNAFKPASSNGTHDVTFTFDATGMEGKTLVVFEEISYNNKVMASHTVLTDIAQTVYVPSLKSQVKDDKTKDQMTLAEKDASITDTIEYSNLTPGTEYVVKGTMMDKAAKTALKDSSGKTVTVSVPFTPTAASGKYDVTFTFDATGMEGKTIVAFQDIYLGDTIIASENDYEIASQTIYIPRGKTTVKDDKTGDKITYAEKEASITDTMSYVNLIPGKKYVLTGKLMDKETNKPVLRKDGTEIVNSTPFTPTAPDGSVDLTFKFDSSLLKGKKIVVFEDVTYNEKSVIIEHNINDEEQTTRIPDGHTIVRDTKTEDHITFASEEAEIIDTVFYENLIPNKEYTLTGYLMDKGTKEPVLDKNGNKITNTTKFTPDKESGTTDIPFKFNSEVLKGQKIVVFEDVYYNGKSVFTHHEIDDVEQTTSIPKGHTVLLDDKTKDHLTLAEEKATVTDTIYYEGLIVGKEYKATGVLMDKATGKPILDDNGKEITNTVPFKAETENGIIKVPFTFDAMLLKGKSVVVFEDVYYGEKSVFCHHDINDIEQTTWIPGGHTTAKDAKTGDHITLAEENAHIDDTITYKNLIADGRTYTATGVLMDKATGEAVLDKNGNEITNTVTFVPEKADGEVVVPFDFDASILKGQKIVVFENVRYGGKDVFIHHELNDVDQTTTIPGGSTQAKDTKTYTNMALAEPQTTIFDFILYEGLIADGREYEATGVLMDQETGNPLLDKNGKEITNTVTFKPEKESGYITVPFTFDSSLLKGKTIVVFEDVYWDKKAVFIHHDITDKPQTVVFPSVLTSATLKNGGKTVTAGDEVTVVDEVLINNILKDEEYIVKGKLMNKSTGKPFTVGGKELTAEKSFKAEDTKTVITTEFTFSTKGIDKIDLVVFEELYVVREINGKKTEVLVADHADLNDKNQTVNIITVPKTGDTSPVLPIAGVCMAALLGIGVVMYKKKKRREE